MKTRGTMRRLMIFISKTDRFRDTQLATAIVERLRHEGLTGATVLQGTAGFGTHRQIHSTALVDLATNLPLVIVVIDEAERVARVMPILEGMVREGLIVVDDVEVTRLSRDKAEKEPAQASEEAQRPVSAFMDRSPVTVRPETPVKDLGAIMFEKQLASLAVVGGQGELLGLVVAEDLLAAHLHLPTGGLHLFGIAIRGRSLPSEDIQSETAGKVMRTHPITVAENEPVGKAVQSMLNNKITAMPVVKGNQLVGMLCLLSVLKKAFSDGENGGRAAEGRSSP